MKSPTCPQRQHHEIRCEERQYIYFDPNITDPNTLMGQYLN
jgi:hypothetical protein